ncbi:uncharacterized protein LOC118600247 [Oryzias melastigma]|uniref:uncharacterized protein LOC118600247 n=1 Tax=Oryzias melastigma TaxID=30732 RepID=UPI00168CD6ED|nr:uncharacterized protein LOC118600247 [Oryzias melastigma]
MGNANEKQSGGSDSSLVTFMKAKHGVECCEFLGYWCQKHGFPEGGSLSKCKLEKLRKNLTEERRMMNERKRVKTKDFKRLDDMNECLKVWEAECEKRERQKACRALTALKIENKKEITDKKADESTENTETSSAPSSFLYPSTQNLWSAAVGPSLDSTPPPYQPQPAQPEPHGDDVEQNAGATAMQPEMTQQQQQQQQQQQLPSLPPPLPPVKMEEVKLRPSAPAEAALSAPAHNNRFVKAKQEELQQKESRTVLTAPMVRVAGPTGDPVIVYRAWTADDIIAASKHLPKPEKGGEVFVRALEDFVRDYVPSSGEMARVMLHILSQSQFSTLRSHFEAQHQPATHDWLDPANQNAANVTYRQWKDGLIAAVRAHFPVQCDHAKVSACTQHEDEDVEELLDRLQTAYDNHSGMTKPDGLPQGDMTPYETLLKQLFLNNLQKPLSSATEDSCVGCEDSTVRLAQMARQAKPEQRRQKEKEAKKEKRKRTVNKCASLVT